MRIRLRRAFCRNHYKKAPKRLQIQIEYFPAKMIKPLTYGNLEKTFRLLDIFFSSYYFCGVLSSGAGKKFEFHIRTFLHI